MARKNLRPRGAQLELAGDLSTAFVNTAAARQKNRQQAIGSYAELLIWGQQIGILQTLDVERLRQVADAQPQAAAAAYARTVALRAALSRLFIAVQTEKPLPESDLRTFNAALSEALPALCVIPGETGPTWGWSGAENALDRMLWPVLHAAAELLVSTGGRSHVRQCAHSDCRLHFVDRSPAGTRRWCETGVCGSRAKSLRFYRRSGRAAREKRAEKIGLYQARRPRKSEIKL